MYGYNREEWLRGHYGPQAGDGSVLDAILRQSTPVSSPGFKYAAYYRRKDKAARDREKMRRKLQADHHDVDADFDPSVFAVNNLRQRRNDRRSSTTISNRLQPVAIVNEQICAGCVFNKESNDCKRPLNWEWKGEMYPLNKHEFEKVKL